MASGVTTRLKVLAKLDIAERRKPQDGRISLNAQSVGRMLDIRVAVLPTVEGEQVVMRLIDKSRKTPTLEQLGLSETMREQISRDHPQADRRAARHRARPARESRRRSTPGSPRSTGPRSTSSPSRTRSSTGLNGINQVQINIKAGMTFAAALRSILRSDPDVIMVGEIRDTETAKISIESALTGPLRALDAAHERRAGRDHAPQRDGCRAVPDGLRRVGRARPAARAQAVHELLRDVRADDGRAAGRPRLAGDGRAARGDGALPQGRLPALQPHGLQGPDRHLPADDHGRRARGVSRRRTRRETRSSASATAKGMRSLWDDGIAKAAAGLTSVEELARVVTI